VNLSEIETRLRFLYEAEHPTAYRFRYGLLAFDVFTILFIVGTSFLDRTPLIAVLDIVLGLAILADFVARLLISQERLRCLLQLSTWADIVAIGSFLAAPFLGEGAAFLRVLRTLRLLHTYQLLARLRADSEWFRRNEEITITMVHLPSSSS
jgi:voltage-gated potassium channel